ncbi:BURP domain-containing protein 13 [Dichanthelium oligosanthes]|uniref:BURP domain-containing protein 13 n=1 Tax=Dichanthelium oligosanthes TaxID=888268 RepID=A0A1E5VAN2_9POAL|nr:BURP domain-containing protein 13 [Dichanthelium oligosanthes]
MVRFVVVLLLAAAAALLAAGRPTNAAPSTAEVLWRAVLPGSAVPDAVLRLLRPDNNVVSKAEAEDVGRPNAPFNYQNYKSSSAPYGYDYKAPSKGDAGDGARDDTPFSYDYKAPSKGGAGSIARDDTPFSYSYKATGEHHHAGGGAATATTTVFFHEEQVRVGERLRFHFPAAAPAALGLLPRHVADAIPFTTPELPAVLALLGVSPCTAQAAGMAETLRTCESPPLAGEAKFCATSLEALVERAMAALGTRDVRAVTSTLPRAGAQLQPYTVRAVSPVDGASFVACHDEAYPYTVYRCHGTGPARAYMVEMEGVREVTVTVATVCHTDTSRWNPEHVSFKLLGTKPGGAPICHLMPYGHIIWAKNVKRSPA